MSQNGDPKMAIFIGIYSIEGLDVGFMRGVAYIYIYVYVSTGLRLAPSAPVGWWALRENEQGTLKITEVIPQTVRYGVLSSEKRWTAVARKGGPRGWMSGSLLGSLGSTCETVPVLFGVLAGKTYIKV